MSTVIATITLIILLGIIFMAIIEDYDINIFGNNTEKGNIVTTQKTEVKRKTIRQIDSMSSIGKYNFTNTDSISPSVLAVPNDSINIYSETKKIGE